MRLGMGGLRVDVAHRGAVDGDGPRLGPWVLGHLVGQARFTTSWHLGALRREEDSIRAYGWRGLLIPAAVIYGAHTVMTGDRMDDQEWYLRFLFLYGFVFPAAFLLRLRGGMVLLPLAILVPWPRCPSLPFVCQCEPYGLVPFLLSLPLLSEAAHEARASWSRPSPTTSTAEPR